MSTDKYDPQAVEESPGKGEYLSKKDAKWIVILLILFAIAAFPIWNYANDQKNKALCSKNSKAIYDALNLYADSNDDRFPALYDEGVGGEPFRDGGKAPLTWASAVSANMVEGASFFCPGADAEEAAVTQAVRGGNRITYGLYEDHATQSRSSITDPDNVVLIAETSNHGTKGSFDPLPFKDGNDAFVVAWNDSNSEPSKESKAVTRLAFREFKDGNATEKAHGRHPNGIHAVSVSGRRFILQPSDSYVQWSIYNLTGRWRTQPQ